MSLDPSRLVAICLTLVGAAAARADVLVDSFAAGSTHGTSVYPVAGGTAHSFGFTVASSHTLDEIDLAVFHYQGFGPNAGVVELRDDAAGKPGAVLESWSVNGLLPEVVSGNPTTTLAPVSLLSTLHPTLAAGARYWVDALEPGSTGGWYDNLYPTGLQDSVTVNGGSSWSAAAFQPDPGALRVLGTVATVPEPGTWGLMLAGLLLLGGMAPGWIGLCRSTLIAVANGRRGRPWGALRRVRLQPPRG
jgi:hypothetical protein